MFTFWRITGGVTTANRLFLIPTGGFSDIFSPTALPNTTLYFIEDGDRHRDNNAKVLKLLQSIVSQKSKLDGSKRSFYFTVRFPTTSKYILRFKNE